jgi:hypothetical protein
MTEIRQSEVRKLKCLRTLLKDIAEAVIEYPEDIDEMGLPRAKSRAARLTREMEREEMICINVWKLFGGALEVSIAMGIIYLVERVWRHRG